MSGETAEFTAPLLREAEGWQDYRLLDSGHGRKLEQVGPYRFIRPKHRRSGHLPLMPLNGSRRMVNLSPVLPGVTVMKAKPANGSCATACLPNGRFNLKT